MNVKEIIESYGLIDNGSNEQGLKYVFKPNKENDDKLYLIIEDNLLNLYIDKDKGDHRRDIAKGYDFGTKERLRELLDRHAKCSNVITK